MLSNDSPTQKFRFRLAAMDLDGTLLGPAKRISAANAAMVRELRAHGVRVVLASGRNHQSMLTYHRQLALSGPIISSQGALVQDAETDRVLHHHCVPAHLAAEIVAKATREQCAVIYYHKDAIYASSRTELVDLYQSRGNDAVMEYGDLSRLAGETPLKIIWLDKPSATVARFARASEHYRGLLEMVVTSPEYLEFNAFGTSKAVGLAAVARHYGIDQSEVLAFGDGDNDVSMLRWAGMGVAMSVATPSAKAAADLVAPLGDNETSLARAVAEVLKRAVAAASRT